MINPEPSQAVEVYTLTPTSSALGQSANNKADNALVLALSPIRSSRTLQSTDIIYRDSEYGYDSYAYSRWSDSPVNLLEIVLQQSLSQRPYLSAVVTNQTDAYAGLLLEGILLDFSHHVQGEDLSTGVVAIRFYLIDVQTKMILGTKVFSVEVTAEPRNSQGATSAINLATKSVIEALNDWLEVQISHLSVE